MPFAKRITPEQFEGEDFDEAWARGWFRMRQTLFTTHFLTFDRRVFAALWLRVGLPGLLPDRKFLELKKLNRRFRAEFGSSNPTEIPTRHEELYQLYRNSLAFEPAPTLRDLQFGDSAQSLFPTWQVELFENEVLVAVGYFDIGNLSAAGIISFYNPAYRKNSLGKYLIYLKMEYCQARGLDYFYPGYLAPGETRFDYKRTMGTATLEYLELASGTWRPYPAMGSPSNPLSTMTTKLSAMGEVLEAQGLSPKIWNYLHLDINLNPQVRGMNLFDFPVFLECFPEVESAPSLVVVYDPPGDRYFLLHCGSVYRFDMAPRDEVFGSDLLAVVRFLFSSSVPEEIAACLAAVIATDLADSAPAPP